MNTLKSPQQKANERYQAESIKPLYAGIIVLIALLFTALIENL